MSSLVSRALESQYGDGEHIETFSRQSATCKSFANHLSVSYALSYCFVAVAPVFHFGAIVTERTLPPPLGGGCRSRISRSLDPLKVPCRSWLSKACGSRQPSSPLAVLFFFACFACFRLFCFLFHLFAWPQFFRVCLLVACFLLFFPLFCSVFFCVFQCLLVHCVFCFFVCFFVFAFCSFICFCCFAFVFAVFQCFCSFLFNILFACLFRFFRLLLFNLFFCFLDLRVFAFAFAFACFFACWIRYFLLLLFVVAVFFHFFWLYVF